MLPLRCGGITWLESLLRFPVGRKLGEGMEKLGLGVRFPWTCCRLEVEASYLFVPAFAFPWGLVGPTPREKCLGGWHGSVQAGTDRMLVL